MGKARYTLILLVFLLAPATQAHIQPNCFQHIEKMLLLTLEHDSLSETHIQHLQELLANWDSEDHKDKFFRSGAVITSWMTAYLSETDKLIGCLEPRGG